VGTPWATALGSTGSPLGIAQVSKVIWGPEAGLRSPGGSGRQRASFNEFEAVESPQITKCPSPAPTKSESGRPAYRGPARARSARALPFELVSTTPVRPAVARECHRWRKHSDPLGISSTTAIPPSAEGAS